MEWQASSQHFISTICLLLKTISSKQRVQLLPRLTAQALLLTLKRSFCTVQSMMEKKWSSTQAQLDSCLDFVRKSLETGSQGEVLRIKMTIVKQVKELTTEFQPEVLKPNTEADVAFSTTPNITALCQNYGQVFTPGSPDPTKCHITANPRDLEVAVVGKNFTVLLQAINFRGHPCKEPIGTLECKLVSEITGIGEKVTVEAKEQSQYEISYQLTIKGGHQLHIKVEEQHIKGSPFTLMVKPHTQEKLGTSISAFSGVNRPWGVAISPRREILVTALWGHCVSVFSPSGKIIRSFGSRGSMEGQFMYPHGLAVDGEGNILVVDGNNHRIQKFTGEGQFLAAIGSKGSGPIQFFLPKDIIFNASNNKLYVVDWNHRIQVLNSDLTFSGTFGSKGKGKGELQNPSGIACDSTGKIYVVDSNNHRIQVFTAEGKFVKMFARQGEGRRNFDHPIGIVIGASDNMVLVSEGYSNCISVFTSEGQFVSSFGEEGGGPGECMGPTGLAVDSNGLVYVCDQGNNRVQVF